MDATASREATWDHACHLQADMFAATDDLGGLEIQLCYYRGFNEFHRSSWCSGTTPLLEEMTAVRCLGGHTQIRKVLEYLLDESRSRRIQAAVFVGDAMEENPDLLCDLAGKLGVRGLPVFVFQEGVDARVTSVFRQIATLSGGAWAPFDLNSASGLRNLLSAVAVYAAGGYQALEKLKSGPEVAGLLKQIRD